MNYHSLWDTAKIIAMNAYIKRSERSQISDLMLHLKLLENKVEANPKTSRRREIIKIRAKINETKTTEKNTKNQ
jgi:hypothetical protein